MTLWWVGTARFFRFNDTVDTYVLKPVAKNIQHCHPKAGADDGG